MNYRFQVRKMLALFLCVVYWGTHCLWAHLPEATIWAERRKHAQKQKPESLLLASLPLPLKSSLAAPGQAPLPSSFFHNPAGALSLPSHSPALPLLRAFSQSEGTVRKIVLPPGEKPDKIVLHIQDVHRHAEAQDRISKMVRSLAQAKVVDLLALEGGFGPLEFSGFHSFPHQDIVQSVADFLMRENRIAGPVHAALTTSLPPVVGVDDSTAYAAHVDAYRRSRETLQREKGKLARAARNSETQKTALFSEALLAYDRHAAAHHAGTLALGEYARRLARQSRPPAVVGSFLEALALEEKMDFSRVETERGRLLENLLQKLTASDLEGLFAAGAAFHSGRLTQENFYGYLKSLCEKSGVSLRDFPAMDNYVRYVLLAGSIPPETLARDLEAMENRGYASLAKTTAQKDLVEKIRYLRLVEKLLDFSLTREEWAKYKEIAAGQKSDFDLAVFEDFYREALKRDQTMARRLLEAMEKSHASRAILVTGGFHSQGIERILKSQGVGIVQVTPRVTRLENGLDALGVFTQEKTPLDRLFQGEKLYLSPPVWTQFLESLAASLCAALAVARKGAGNVQSSLLKTWPQVARRVGLKLLRRSAKSIALGVKDIGSRRARRLQVEIAAAPSVEIQNIHARENNWPAWTNFASPFIPSWRPRALRPLRWVLGQALEAIHKFLRSSSMSRSFSLVQTWLARRGPVSVPALPQQASTSFLSNTDGFVDHYDLLRVDPADPLTPAGVRLARAQEARRLEAELGRPLTPLEREALREASRVLEDPEERQRFDTKRKKRLQNSQERRPVTVALVRPLDRYAARRETVEGSKLSDVLDGLILKHPALGNLLRDGQGNYRVGRYNFLLNNQSAPRGLATVLRAGDRLAIMPKIGGGALSAAEKPAFELWDYIYRTARLETDELIREMEDATAPEYMEDELVDLILKKMSEDDIFNQEQIKNTELASLLKETIQDIVRSDKIQTAAPMDRTAPAGLKEAWDFYDVIYPPAPDRRLEAGQLVLLARLSLSLKARAPAQEALGRARKALDRFGLAGGESLFPAVVAGLSDILGSSAPEEKNLKSLDELWKAFQDLSPWIGDTERANLLRDVWDLVVLVQTKERLTGTDLSKVTYLRNNMKSQLNRVSQAHQSKLAAVQGTLDDLSRRLVSLTPHLAAAEAQWLLELLTRASRDFGKIVQGDGGSQMGLVEEAAKVVSDRLAILEDFEKRRVSVSRKLEALRMAVQEASQGQHLDTLLATVEEGPDQYAWRSLQAETDTLGSQVDTLSGLLANAIIDTGFAANLDMLEQDIAVLEKRAFRLMLRTRHLPAAYEVFDILQEGLRRSQDIPWNDIAQFLTIPMREQFDGCKSDIAALEAEMKLFSSYLDTLMKAPAPEKLFESLVNGFNEILPSLRAVNIQLNRIEQSVKDLEKAAPANSPIIDVMRRLRLVKAADPAIASSEIRKLLDWWKDQLPKESLKPPPNSPIEKDMTLTVNSLAMIEEQDPFKEPLRSSWTDWMVGLSFDDPVEAEAAKERLLFAGRMEDWKELKAYLKVVKSGQREKPFSPRDQAALSLVAAMVGMDLKRASLRKMASDDLNMLNQDVFDILEDIVTSPAISGKPLEIAELGMAKIEIQTGILKRSPEWFAAAEERLDRLTGSSRRDGLLTAYAWYLKASLFLSQGRSEAALRACYTAHKKSELNPLTQGFAFKAVVDNLHKRWKRAGMFEGPEVIDEILEFCRSLAVLQLSATTRRNLFDDVMKVAIVNSGALGRAGRAQRRRILEAAEEVLRAGPAKEINPAHIFALAHRYESFVLKQPASPDPAIVNPSENALLELLIEMNAAPADITRQLNKVPGLKTNEVLGFVLTMRRKQPSERFEDPNAAALAARALLDEGLVDQFQAALLEERFTTSEGFIVENSGIEKVISLYEEAAQLTSWETFVSAPLAELYLSLGEREKALQIYRRMRFSPRPKEDEKRLLDKMGKFGLLKEGETDIEAAQPSARVRGQEAAKDKEGSLPRVEFPAQWHGMVKRLVADVVNFQQYRRMTQEKAHWDSFMKFFEIRHDLLSEETFAAYQVPLRHLLKEAEVWETSEDASLSKLSFVPYLLEALFYMQGIPQGLTDEKGFQKITGFLDRKAIYVEAHVLRALLAGAVGLVGIEQILARKKTAYEKSMGYLETVAHGVWDSQVSGFLGEVKGRLIFRRPDRPENYDLLDEGTKNLETAIGQGFVSYKNYEALGSMFSKMTDIERERGSIDYARVKREIMIYQWLIDNYDKDPGMPLERLSPGAYHFHLITRYKVMLTQMPVDKAWIELADKSYQFLGEHGYDKIQQGQAWTVAGFYYDYIHEVLWPQALDAEDPTRRVTEIKALSRRAMELMDAAIQVDPNEVISRLGRAKLLMDLGRLEEAKRDIQKAIALDPSHPSIPKLLRILAGELTLRSQTPLFRETLLRLRRLAERSSRQTNVETRRVLADLEGLLQPREWPYALMMDRQEQWFKKNILDHPDASVADKALVDVISRGLDGIILLGTRNTSSPVLTSFGSQWNQVKREATYEGQAADGSTGRFSVSLDFDESPFESRLATFTPEDRALAIRLMEARAIALWLSSLPPDADSAARELASQHRGQVRNARAAIGAAWATYIGLSNGTIPPLDFFQAATPAEAQSPRSFHNHTGRELWDILSDDFENHYIANRAQGQPRVMTSFRNQVREKLGLTESDLPGLERLLENMFSLLAKRYRPQPSQAKAFGELEQAWELYEKLRDMDSGRPHDPQLLIEIMNHAAVIWRKSPLQPADLKGHENLKRKLTRAMEAKAQKAKAEIEDARKRFEDLQARESRHNHRLPAAVREQLAQRLETLQAGFLPDDTDMSWPEFSTQLAEAETLLKPYESTLQTIEGAQRSMAEVDNILARIQGLGPIERAGKAWQEGHFIPFWTTALKKLEALYTEVQALSQIVGALPVGDAGSLAGMEERLQDLITATWRLSLAALEAPIARQLTHLLINTYFLEFDPNEYPKQKDLSVRLNKSRRDIIFHTSEIIEMIGNVMAHAAPEIPFGRLYELVGSLPPSLLAYNNLLRTLPEFPPLDIADPEQTPLDLSYVVGKVRSAMNSRSLNVYQDRYKEAAGLAARWEGIKNGPTLDFRGASFPEEPILEPALIERLESMSELVFSEAIEKRRNDLQSGRLGQHLPLDKYVPGQTQSFLKSVFRDEKDDVPSADTGMAYILLLSLIHNIKPLNNRHKQELQDGKLALLEKIHELNQTLEDPVEADVVDMELSRLLLVKGLKEKNGREIQRANEILSNAGRIDPMETSLWATRAVYKAYAALANRDPAAAFASWPTEQVPPAKTIIFLRLATHLLLQRWRHDMEYDHRLFEAMLSVIETTIDQDKGQLEFRALIFLSDLATVCTPGTTPYLAGLAKAVYPLMVRSASALGDGEWDFVLGNLINLGCMAGETLSGTHRVYIDVLIDVNSAEGVMREALAKVPGLDEAGLTAATAAILSARADQGGQFGEISSLVPVLEGLVNQGRISVLSSAYIRDRACIPALQVLPEQAPGINEYLEIREKIMESLPQSTEIWLALSEIALAAGKAEAAGQDVAKAIQFSQAGEDLEMIEYMRSRLSNFGITLPSPSDEGAEIKAPPTSAPADVLTENEFREIRDMVEEMTHWNRDPGHAKRRLSLYPQEKIRAAVLRFLEGPDENQIWLGLALASHLKMVEFFSTAVQLVMGMPGIPSAAWALGFFDTPQAEDALVAVLLDQERPPIIRQRAADAFALMTETPVSSRAMEALLRAVLSDPDERVRRAAADTLEKLHAKASIGGTQEEAADAAPAGSAPDSQPGPQAFENAFRAFSWKEIFDHLKSRQGGTDAVRRLYIDLNTIINPLGFTASFDALYNYRGHPQRSRQERAEHEERMLAHKFFQEFDHGLVEGLRALRENGVEIIGFAYDRRPQDVERTRRILTDIGLGDLQVLFSGSREANVENLVRSLGEEDGRPAAVVHMISMDPKSLVREARVRQIIRPVEGIWFIDAKGRRHPNALDSYQEAEKALDLGQKAWAFEYIVSAYEAAKVKNGFVNDAQIRDFLARLQASPFPLPSGVLPDRLMPPMNDATTQVSQPDDASDLGDDALGAAPEIPKAVQTTADQPASELSEIQDQSDETLSQDPDGVWVARTWRPVLRRLSEGDIARFYVSLDDVLFEPKGSVASGEWLDRRTSAVGADRAHWESRRHQARMLTSGFFKTTEPGLAEHIRSLPAHVEIVGLTERGRGERAATELILQELGLDIQIVYCGNGLRKQAELKKRLTDSHGKSLVMDNQTGPLKTLAKDLSLPRDVLWVRYDRPARNGELSAEKFMDATAQAVQQGHDAQAVEYAVNTLDLANSAPLDQRVSIYRKMGAQIESLQGSGHPIDDLLIAYFSQVTALLAAVHRTPRQMTPEVQALARDYFKFFTPHNPDTFYETYLRNLLTFEATPHEAGRGQDHKILIDQNNMYAFLEPLLAYIGQQTEPMTVVVADTGARPFMPLIERFIEVAGLTHIQVKLLPISIKTAGDSALEIDRWLSLGEQLAQGKDIPDPQEKEIAEQFADWERLELLKGRHVLFVDDNVVSGQTAETARRVFVQKGAKSFVVGTPFVFGDERAYSFPIISSLQIPGAFVWRASKYMMRPPAVTLTRWEGRADSVIGVSRRRRFDPSFPEVVDKTMADKFLAESLAAFDATLGERLSSLLDVAERLAHIDPLDLEFSDRSALAEAIYQDMDLPQGPAGLPDTWVLRSGLRLTVERSIQQMVDDERAPLAQTEDLDRFLFSDLKRYAILENGHRRGFVELIQVADGLGEKSIMIKSIQPEFDLQVPAAVLVDELLRRLETWVNNETDEFRSLFLSGRFDDVSDRMDVRSALFRRYNFRARSEERPLLWEMGALLETLERSRTDVLRRTDLPEAHWVSLLRRLAARPSLISQETLAGIQESENLHRELLENLGRGFDVLLSGDYRVLARRLTEEQRASSRQRLAMLETLGFALVGQHEEEVFANIQAAAGLDFPPSIGQAEFLERLKKRAAWLRQEGPLPPMLEAFIARRHLQTTDWRNWTQANQLAFQAVETYHAVLEGERRGFPKLFFQEEGADARIRAAVEAMLANLPFSCEAPGLNGRVFAHAKLGYLWDEIFRGRLFAVAELLFPGQYAEQPDGSISPRALSAADITSWFRTGADLVPGRAAPVSLDETGRLTVGGEDLAADARLPERRPSDNDKPWILVSVRDPNQGLTLMLVSAEDHANRDYRRPGGVYQFNRPNSRVESIDLALRDLLAYCRDGRELVVDFQSRKDTVIDRVVHGQLEFSDVARGVARLRIPGTDLVFHLAKETWKAAGQDWPDAFGDVTPQAVFLQFQRDENQGVVVHMFKAEEDVPPQDTRPVNSAPIQTYRYYRETQQVVPVELGKSDVIDAAKGARLARPGRGAHFTVGSRGRIEILSGFSQDISLSIPGHILGAFQQQGILLPGQKVTVTVRHDAVNYGQYLEASLILNGQTSPIGRYLSPREGEPAHWVDFDQAAWVDRVSGRRNIHFAPVQVEPYLHPTRVPSDGRVQFEGRAGAVLEAVRLERLVGKSVVFVPFNHQVLGMVVHVHDAEAHAKRPRRPPEHILRPNRDGTSLVPLSTQDQMFLEPATEELLRRIPLDTLLDLIQFDGNTILRVFRALFRDPAQHARVMSALFHALTERTKQRAKAESKARLSSNRPRPQKLMDKKREQQAALGLARLVQAGEWEPEELLDLENELIENFHKIALQRLDHDYELKRRQLVAQGEAPDPKILLEEVADAEIREVEQAAAEETPAASSHGLVLQGLRVKAWHKTKEFFLARFDFLRDHIWHLNRRTHLDPYQVDQVRFALEAPKGQGVLNADDRGLGKTIEMLTAAFNVKGRKLIVVIGPGRVRDGVIIDEINNSFGGDPEDEENRKRQVLDQIKISHLGTKTYAGPLALNISLRSVSIDQADQYLQGDLKSGQQDVHVLFLSFEQSRERAAVLENLADQADVLVVDEAHNLKDEDSDQAQAVNFMAKKMKMAGKKVIYGTGTPMPNLPEDLWAPLSTLHSLERLYERLRPDLAVPVRHPGEDLKKYLVRAEEPLKQRFRQILRSRNIRELLILTPLLHEIMMRRQKSILPGMAQVQDEVVGVDLLEGTIQWNGETVQVDRTPYALQTTLYALALRHMKQGPEFERRLARIADVSTGGDWSKDLDEEPEQGSNGLSRALPDPNAHMMIRLRQIGSDPGTLVGGPQESIKWRALDLVIDQIVKSGDKMVVFTNHKRAAEKLKQRYEERLAAFCLTSNVPIEDRPQVISGFRTHPGPAVMICTDGVGAESHSFVSWTNSQVTTVVHLDRPMQHGTLLQALDRINRRVRGHSQMLPRSIRQIYIDFVGSASIDSHLGQLLDLKRDYGEILVDVAFWDEVLDGLKDLARQATAGLAEEFERDKARWSLSESQEYYIRHVMPWEHGAASLDKDLGNSSLYWTEVAKADFLVHNAKFLEWLRQRAGPSWTAVAQGSRLGAAHEAWKQLMPALAREGASAPQFISVEDIPALADRLIGASRDEGHQIIKADPDKTGLPSGSVDFLENSTLAAVPPAARRAALLEAWRVLKHQGLLVLVSRGGPFAWDFVEDVRAFGFEPLQEASPLTWSDEFQARAAWLFGSPLAERITARANPGAQILVLQKMRDISSEAGSGDLPMAAWDVQDVLRELGRIETEPVSLREIALGASDPNRQQAFRQPNPLLFADSWEAFESKRDEAGKRNPKTPHVEFYQVKDRVKNTAGQEFEVISVNGFGRHETLEVKGPKSTNKNIQPNVTGVYRLSRRLRVVRSSGNGADKSALATSSLSVELGRWWLRRQGRSSEDPVLFASQSIAPWFEPLVSLGLPGLFSVAMAAAGITMGIEHRLLLSGASQALFLLLHWNGLYLPRAQGPPLRVPFHQAWENLFTAGLFFHGPFYAVSAIGPFLPVSLFVVLSLAAAQWAVTRHRVFNRSLTSSGENASDSLPVLVEAIALAPSRSVSSDPGQKAARLRLAWRLQSRLPRAQTLDVAGHRLARSLSQITAETAQALQTPGGQARFEMARQRVGLRLSFIDARRRQLLLRRISLSNDQTPEMTSRQLTLGALPFSNSVHSLDGYMERIRAMGLEGQALVIVPSEPLARNLRRRAGHVQVQAWPEVFDIQGQMACLRWDKVEAYVLAHPQFKAALDQVQAVRPVLTEDVFLMNERLAKTEAFRHVVPLLLDRLLQGLTLSLEELRRIDAIARAFAQAA